MDLHKGGSHGGPSSKLNGHFPGSKKMQQHMASQCSSFPYNLHYDATKLRYITTFLSKLGHQMEKRSVN